MKQITKFFILVGVVSFTSLSQAACSFDVEVGDYLKFSTPDMAVEKSCESITVNLKHSGKLPANIMGHNWVLSADADVQALATEGMSAGLVSNYVTPGDARVLAASSVIGGGESTSRDLLHGRIGEWRCLYFFLFFPGHSYSMRGALTVSP